MAMMFRRHVKDYDMPLLGDDANIIQFYKQHRAKAQLLVMARMAAIS
jgi:hypothetical protein